MDINDYINSIDGNYHGSLLTSRYCSAVATDSIGISKIAEYRGDFWGDLRDFTDSVAKVYVSCLRISNPTYKGILTTPTPFDQENIEVAPINEDIHTSVDNRLTQWGCVGIHMVADKYIAKPIDYTGYSPYTTHRLYLPFVGLIDIDLAPFYDKNMKIYIGYNALEASGTYYIFYTDTTGENAVLYSQLDFTFGIDVILGSTNAGDIARNITLDAIKSGVGVLGTFISGSLAKPSISTSTTHTTKEYDIKSRAPYKGAKLLKSKTGSEVTDSERVSISPPKQIDMVTPASDAINSGIDVLNRVYSGITNPAKSTPSLATSSKQIILQTIKKKLVPVTDDYKHNFGLPLGEFRRLGDVNGYTKITKFHIENVGLNTIPEHELSLLHEALMDGIIL